MPTHHRPDALGRLVHKAARKVTRLFSGSPTRQRVLYWVRGSGMGGKDRVKMYVQGRLAKDTDEGRRGDVKGRPYHLGPGPYTAVYAADDFETEDGRPAFGHAHSWKGQPIRHAKAAKLGHRRAGHHVALSPKRIGPDTKVFSASAWWRDSDPSMQVVALTAAKAKTDIFNMMRGEAQEAADIDDEYATTEDAMDNIKWSGVHAFALKDIASTREMDTAIRELVDSGVWYPER